MSPVAPNEITLREHYASLVNAIRIGRFVPFLGAGVNLCKRQGGFEPGKTLPSGGELADYLARTFDYPPKEITDLARVCEYISMSKRSGELNILLREIFEPEFTPTKIHHLLASIPARLRKANAGKPPTRAPHLRLVVTTNYDDLVERAFTAAGQPYDLVWYEAEGKFRGRFYHLAYGKMPRLIEDPQQYDEFDLIARPVVLKVHGAVDRLTTPGRRTQDSFVISEDHYLEYMARTNSGNFLPTLLTQELGDCHLLFIGYGLRDWNLRVILRRVWEDARLNWPSWAIQKNVDELDVKLWQNRGVELVDVDLGDYADGLEAALTCLPE